MTAPACSSESLAAEEPMLGTAPTVTRILIVEQPGPWGRDALLDSRMDPGVRSGLARIAADPDTKVFLTRRGDHRSLTATRQVWSMERVAHQIRADNWAQPVREQVRFPAPVPAPVAATGHPALFICTNGARDRCCALLGRRILPEVSQAWEISHIGGHRFAPTALRFPEGLLLGRLTSAGAADCLTNAAPPGRFLRGRFGRTAWQQVAESAVADVTGLPLTALDGSGEPADTIVTGPDGSDWQVRLSEQLLPERRSSCQKQPVVDPTWRAMRVIRKR